jgi:hypothetical protein
MMYSILSVLLLATSIAANDLIDNRERICNDIESLDARRDSERTRSIVATGSCVILVAPLLPLGMGANTLVRSNTSDQRFSRIFDKFDNDRLQLQEYIEQTCGLRTTVTYLKRGSNVTRPLAITGVVLGSIELVMIVFIFLCGGIACFI